MITIRKNSLKRITALLTDCVIIRQYKGDDMGCSNRTVTAADVMALADRFDHVYCDDEIVSVGIHGNHFYTGYRSVAGAKARLHPDAFAQLFPAEQAA